MVYTVQKKQKEVGHEGNVVYDIISTAILRLAMEIENVILFWVGGKASIVIIYC